MPSLAVKSRPIRCVALTLRCRKTGESLQQTRYCTIGIRGDESAQVYWIYESREFLPGVGGRYGCHRSRVCRRSNVAPYAIIHTSLQSTINTKTAHVGKQISASVVAPHANARLQGATIVGHLTFVQHAGRGTNPGVAGVSDRIVFSNGTSSPIACAPLGTMKGSPNRSSGARTAGGALAGMAVGNMLGKSLFGGNAGGAVGAIAGGAMARNVRQDITIPAGTKMDLELSKPLSLK